MIDRWGDKNDEYYDRVPLTDSFPEDDPETKVSDFYNIISSGDYGLYIMATHGDDKWILIEPYMFQPTPPHAYDWEAVSKHLAMMAWYRYTGEDFCDPEIMQADFDGDGTPLAGPNGKVEIWVDETGVVCTPPPPLPTPDDDMDEIPFAIFDNNEDGISDGFDANGDGAPGLRGDPYNLIGDADADGSFLVNEIGVWWETMKHENNFYDFYSVWITPEFVQNHGAAVSNGFMYLTGCNSFDMSDAWTNPPMSIKNYISHTCKVKVYHALPAMDEFFRYFGHYNFLTGGWNYNIEEAYSHAKQEPNSCLAFKSEDRCTARMVLYQGDIYVDNTPPSNPHGDLGSISNPYTDIQSGLSAASSGETVFVAEGTYNISTTLTVPPGVTLKGAGPHKTVLVGVHDINIPMFRFDTSFTEVTSIQDFKMTGCYDAIAINVGSGTPIDCPLEIRNNLFDNNAYGIRMNLASPTASSFDDPYGLDNNAPKIYNNIFYNNSQDGINCIYTRAHITHNTIGNSVNIGIYIGYGDGYDFPFVENNIVVNCNYGLFCFDMGPYAYPEVSRNIFWGNAYDVHCPGCYDIDELNDIGINPDHVSGPFSVELGSAGNYYLDAGSPAKNRASDVIDSSDLGRLTTNPEQTPGAAGSLSDRGYYYHIRCEDLPTYTPVPTNPPTNTPSGPTATPTPYQSPTPTFTETPIPTPAGTVLAMGYYEDFEDTMRDPSDWTTTGLWHRPASGSSYSNPHSGEYSMRYGRENQLDYDTGDANSGELTLRPLYVEGSSAVLTFYSWEQTEGVSTGVDTRTVWASVDNGITWEKIYQSTNNSSTWHLVTIPLNYSDQYVLLQFRFDTVDAEFNDYRGWYIDDVYIGAGPVPSMSISGLILLLVLLSVVIMIGKRKGKQMGNEH